jgi:hypothetical protein
MEKVTLGDEIVLYRVPFTPSTPKEILLFGVEEHINNNKTMEACDAFDYHGEYPELNEIENRGIDICLEIAKEENISYTNHNYNSWINRVRKQNPVQYFFAKEPYHNHVELNEGSGRFEPKYTFIYYLQLPDNLQNDEGHLVLKDTKGNVYSILPKENEFLIHQSNIDHYPKHAPNSTVDRFIIATNVGFEY